MTEVETLLAHMRELEYAVTAEGPGHPRAWSVEGQATIYALESGRVLDWRAGELLARTFRKIVADVFGPDWKTLAQVCGGQAPTIGRVVHVWSAAALPPYRNSPPETPLPCMIYEVRDDGAVDLEIATPSGFAMHWVPYETNFDVEKSPYFWTWPRVIR